MKLISSNIEGSKHLDRILPFIIKESPDVLCLQEVFKMDLHHFEKLGYKCHFLPLTIFMRDGESREHGIALCSKTEITNSDSMYYLDFETTLPTHDPKNIPETVHYGLLHGNIMCGDDTFLCATTHFTWTAHGSRPSLAQTESLTRLFNYTDALKSHVLCGDFNIPRHESVLYTQLAEHYSDNVPLQYTSSLDKNIHHLGKDSEKDFLFSSFMVDYVFTKPPYKATDVRLEFGLSDHAAIVATISRE